MLQLGTVNEFVLISVGRVQTLILCSALQYGYR